MARAERLARIAAAYDGTCSLYEHGNEDGGNRQNVVVRSNVLTAAIRRYIGGDNARDVAASVVESSCCWSAATCRWWSPVRP